MLTAAGHSRLADNGAGRSARPSRPGGGAVHAEGGQDVLKRPRHHCMQAWARANEFGPILCVSMRVKELGRPMTEPLAEWQGVPFGAEERWSCTYTQKFPANPGAEHDNRVIDQPLAAPSGKASMEHAMAVADQEIPEARRRLRASGLLALAAAHRGEVLYEACL